MFWIVFDRVDFRICWGWCFDYVFRLFGSGFGVCYFGLEFVSYGGL